MNEDRLNYLVFDVDYLWDKNFLFMMTLDRIRMIVLGKLLLLWLRLFMYWIFFIGYWFIYLILKGVNQPANTPGLLFL